MLLNLESVKHIRYKRFDVIEIGKYIRRSHFLLETRMVTLELIAEGKCTQSEKAELVENKT